MLWLWPEPIPFRLGYRAPRAEWAIRALDRLRELDLLSGDPPLPIPKFKIQFESGARLLEDFCFLMRGGHLNF